MFVFVDAMKYFTVATMQKSTRIKRTKTDIKKDCSVPRGGDMHIKHFQQMINGDNIVLLNTGLHKTGAIDGSSKGFSLAARTKYKYLASDFLYPGARWFSLLLFFLPKKKAPDKLKT